MNFIFKTKKATLKWLFLFYYYSYYGWNLQVVTGLAYLPDAVCVAVT
jgi:hypothetical protein